VWCWHLWFATSQGHSRNCCVGMNRNCCRCCPWLLPARPRPLPSLPGQVVLEFDGPLHFFANDPKTHTGRTELRNRLLRHHFGARNVLQLPYWAWGTGPGGMRSMRAGRLRNLVALLQTAGVAGVDIPEQWLRDEVPGGPGAASAERHDFTAEAAGEAGTHVLEELSGPSHGEGGRRQAALAPELATGAPAAIDAPGLGVDQRRQERRAQRPPGQHGASLANVAFQAGGDSLEAEAVAARQFSQ
jgi:hypothetical protein